MPCSRCGFDNPTGFRFCGSCGTPLLPVEELGREEERKIVTALFCDVVGFTQRAALLDPEDVRRMIDPFYEAARRELERFGGTVEKFIGDAVCALFGAPQAHGDDAARAVFAALELRNAVVDLNEADPELNLHVRIGIATGEAVVELGARPSQGEGMAWGDVINTASRLQGSASEDGILVDEATYRATRDEIDYGVAEPVHAKGKAEEILVWQALARRARIGVALSEAGREPLVGRADEVSLLGSALDRIGRERTPELITLVGPPGIGKSRLVFELFRRVELGSALITWRHGRSPPYGGSSYWALGEMVKGQAGILDTDGAAAASEKLGRAVRDLAAAPADAARIETHLRSLVGLGGAVEEADERGAVFAAWRHFFEALARQRPLVLVLEDIHWADDGLLDFVEHVLDWARDIPLLIVCTARPELLERRPRWGNRERGRTVLLTPLSEDETESLVGQLSGGVISPEAAAAVVGAASGNPLYAVEYVRMLEDRGLLRASAGGAAASGRALPVPESIHGIIAARLDALTPDDKTLLQAASVVGRVVWPGALASISGRSRKELERHLAELERKEFLIGARSSSVEREREYRFRHVLVRDVAYAQIPRSRRGESHRRTAEWLASLSPDRAGDRAEMLAHHYLAAYELLRTGGSDTVELSERVRTSLRDAGDRALSLHSFPAAVRHFRAALELWPEDDPERPSLLFRLGKSLFYADMEGADVLSEAEAGLLETGDRETAAEARSYRAALAHHHGEPLERVFEHARRAAAIVDGLAASHSKVEVLVDLSTYLGLALEHQQAIEVAREALTAAEALGLRELQARALAMIGISRGLSGDRGGRIDLERSIAIMEEIDSHHVVYICGILADLEMNLGNLERCFALREKARRNAERFGHAAHIQWLKAERVAEDYWRGTWDEAISQADEFVAQAEAGSPHFMEGYCRGIRGRMRLARGDLPGALEDAAEALRQARASNEPQMLYPALAFQARALAASDALEPAAQVADELLGQWSPKRELFPASSWVVDLVCALDTLGRPNELVEAAEGPVGKTAWLEGAIAFAQGDFEDAADVFARIGSRPDEAVARVRAAERRLSAGEGAARSDLERGLAFFREVGADAYLSQAEALQLR